MDKFVESLTGVHLFLIGLGALVICVIFFSVVIYLISRSERKARERATQELMDREKDGL